MIAEALALLGVLSFASSNIVTRRAVVKVLDTSTGLLISLLVGTLLFTLILIGTGQIGIITRLSMQSYLWLSAAGIVHLIVGRGLFWKCVQTAGANIAMILTSVRPLVAVILGISVLSEPFTWQLAVGVVLIVFGVIMAATNPEMLRSGKSFYSGISRRALILGGGTGVAWGLTPIMIKLGLNDAGSSVAGVFISYAAATCIFSFILWNRARKTSLTRMNRREVGLFSVAGLFSTIAQLLRYLALGMAPASVISPLMSTAPVLTLVVSFLFNRKLETFNRNVIIGAVAVVIGAILVV